MIEIAVLGFGTVGQGIVEMIDDNRKQIERTVPEGIHVKYILDLRDFPDSPYADRVVHDYEIIISDPDIRIICEAMGGKEPAFTFSRRALEKGISVCTSNKELVAAFGPKLLATAAEHGCTYDFEASVGGGIPLLRTINTSLSQENITSCTGILNGTTNYILTKMNREGADFGAMLKEAQELGYAERNPEADIKGYDTGRKICILASLISGKTVSFEDITCEGITEITPLDFAAASAAGYAIKLLGKMELLEDGRVSVLTAPFLIPTASPLAPVEDVFNGVLIHGTMVDDVMFTGRGAGRYPTASAVVSDVVNLARTLGSGSRCLWDGTKNAELLPAAERREGFYLRTLSEAGDAVLEAADGIFEILCDSLEEAGQRAFLVPEMTEEQENRIFGGMEGILECIRVEESRA